MLITKIRKKTTLIIWGFLGFFLVFGVFITFGTKMFGGGTKYQEKKEYAYKVPNAVVSVDGREIGSQLFRFRYLMMRQNYEAMGYRIDNYQVDMYLKYQVLQSMIAQELLLGEARKRNVRADSAELAKLMKQEKARLIGPSDPLKDPSIQGRAKAFFTEKQRDKQLREMLSRMGVSYDVFKQSVRRDATQEKVVAILGEDLSATDKKAAGEKINNIKKMLASGEPFENIARQFSEDDATKQNGGDLGWTKHGVLPEAYETAAFALQPYQLSQPVQTDLGIHLIQLVEKKVVGDANYNEAAVTAEIRAKKESESAQVTPDEIKNAYEEIHTRHILIRMKSKETLASAWVEDELKKATHKIIIVNPELRAFDYLNRQFLNPSAAAQSPDLDRAVKLYDDAIKADPGNYNLYYQKGSIYERKNSEWELKQAQTKANDPYAKPIAESQSATGTASAPAAALKENKETDKNRFLNDALICYQKARELAQNSNIFDPIVLIAVGNTAKKLGKKGTAIDAFAEAVDFSAGNMQYLKQIEEGLKDFDTKKAKNALKDARELIADLEAIELEKQKEADAAAATTEPQTVIVQPEESGTGETGKAGEKTTEKQPSEKTEKTTPTPTVRKTAPTKKTGPTTKPAPVSKPSGAAPIPSSVQKPEAGPEPAETEKPAAPSVPAPVEPQKQ